MSAADELRDGRYLGVDAARYHALPGLSPTGAVRLLESPRAYRYVRTEETPAMRLGTAIHEMTLGNASRVRPLPDISGRSKAGRAALEEARAASGDGVLLLPPDDYERAVASASAARRAMRWLYDADPQAAMAEHEVSMVWGGGARRGRPDILADEECVGGRRLVVADLKTTHAIPSDLAGHVARAGWHTQVAAYLDGATRTCADTVADYAAYVVVVETTGAHDAVVVQLSPEYLDIGHAAWVEACALYDRCVTDDHWPYRGELTGVRMVHAPGWLRPRGHDTGDSSAD